ncbi:MAG: N-acetyltransferase [Clostridiales bacterium]|nr:N-acetyltransferase [Clostridiales bacterium]
MNDADMISLGRITAAHREALLELLCDADVTLTYMVPALDSDEKKDAMFQRFSGLSSRNDRYVRGILLSGELIGVINDVGIENGEIELGYAMLPRFWGHGYMTQAVRQAMTDLSEAGFRRVKCGAFEDNRKSIAVMKRCGMKEIPDTEAVTYRGKEHRCVYFAADLPGQQTQHFQ